VATPAGSALIKSVEKKGRRREGREEKKFLPSFPFSMMAFMPEIYGTPMGWCASMKQATPKGCLWSLGRHTIPVMP